MLPIDLDEAKNYIVNLERDLQSKFRARNHQIDFMRDLYFLRHQAHIGNVLTLPGTEMITSNKATNIVDLGVGILSSNPMKIRAYRVVDETQDSQKEAQNVIKFLRGLLYINDERQGSDIEVQAIFNALLDGQVVVYQTWNSDAEPTQTPGEMGTPGLTFSELPLDLTILDIKNVFPVTGGRRGNKQVIYSCRRLISDIEDEWGVDLGYSNENRERTEVDYIDYWGFEFANDSEPDTSQSPQDEPKVKKLGQEVVVNAVIADNKWIRQPEIMEGYDDLPFTFGCGRLTTSVEPEETGLSLLYPTANAILDYEVQLIQHRRLVMLYAALPPFIRTNPGREKPIFDAILGNVTHLETGEEFGFPTWPGTPPDVRMELTNAENSIQEGSFPSVAYGEGANATSGYAISQLTDSGRIRLNQFQKNLERFWSMVFRKALSLTAQFASNVNLQVYGRLHDKPFALPIRGSQMQGFRVDVKIAAKFPQDESRKVAAAMQLKQSRLLPTRTLQENYLDVDDPEQEEERQLEEDAMQDQTLRQTAIREAMGEFDPSLVQSVTQGAPPSPQQNSPGMPPQGQPSMAPQTQQQNAGAQMQAGMPMTVPQGPPGMPMPPASGMPMEMMGMQPPQAMGGPPPGQNISPDFAQLMNLLQGGGM
jgi:hypothetical protein